MSSQVELTFHDPATKLSSTEKFDFIVVACDPRTLPFASLTPHESIVNDSLSSYTFRTSLYKGRRPKAPQLPNTSPSGPREETPNYVVRFDPEPLAALDGQVYGFRDEVMARDPNYSPSANGVTWLTTYQLEGLPLLGRDVKEVEKELNKKRNKVIGKDGLDWIDFLPVEEKGQMQPEVGEIVDYFPHFEKDGLEMLLPWKIKEEQGKNCTLYVSAFTSFESVLHIYLYQRELMREDGEVMQKYFPKDKKARIAVIGAGPSGILFASLFLRKRGYDNFVIYEKTERFGGKTLTHRRRAPADKNTIVPCELGTCYLSLGYEPMFDLFEEYDAGRIVELDRDGFKFRSIIDPDVAKTKEERENGIDFGKWTLRRNGPIEFIERISFLKAAIRYVAVHYATMGMGLEDSMPFVPPTEANVLENLGRLLGLVNDENDDDKEDGKVNTKSLYKTLMKKEEKKEKGFFSWVSSIDDVIMDKLDDWIQVDELEKACRNVFNMSFATYLDENKMSDLKSTFIYAYQVQGYGTIERIPAYYGLIWVNPGMLLGEVRQLFSTDPDAKERGGVNVLTEGWLRLWEQMVAKEKLDIQFKTNIVKVKRKIG